MVPALRIITPQNNYRVRQSIQFAGDAEDAKKLKMLEQQPIKASDLVKIQAKPNPSIQKPNLVNRLLAKFSARISQGWRWFKRNILSTLYRPFISKADRTIEDILNEKRPDRVSKETFSRPSRGVSKAVQQLNKHSELARNYAQPHYLNQEIDYPLKWSPTRIVRDALQNFYDGQGQQLNATGPNATKIEINRQRLKGTTQIRVSASANYDAERLLSMGSTTKKGSSVDTGGFGEGAKQMAFSLLKDYGVDKVTFRSREWQIDFTLQPIGKKHSSLAPNKKGLHAQLSILDKPIAGNDLSFQVKSRAQKELIQQFEQGRNLFYHNENPDMKNPTYENKVGGFTLISEKEAPHFYHAGQRRGVGHGDNLMGLNGLHLWTHEKQLQELTRDRSSYDEQGARDCLGKIVDQMSSSQAVEALNVMKKTWFPTNNYCHPEENTEEANKALLLEKICDRLAELNKKERNGADKMPNGFKLPEGLFYAATNPGWFSRGDKTVDLLKSKGYIPVREAFRVFNVPSADTLANRLGYVKETQTKTVQTLTQTEKDKKRIAVLKEIMTAYSKSLPTHLSDLQDVLDHPWEITEPKSSYLNRKEPHIYFDHTDSKVRLNPACVRTDNFWLLFSKIIHNNTLMLTNAREQDITHWALTQAPNAVKWNEKWNS